MIVVVLSQQVIAVQQQLQRAQLQAEALGNLIATHEKLDRTSKGIA